MNPSRRTDILSTPDFWLLLLFYEFMGEEKFREILESIEKVSDGENINETLRRNDVQGDCYRPVSYKEERG